MEYTTNRNVVDQNSHSDITNKVILQKIKFCCFLLEILPLKLHAQYLILLVLGNYNEYILCCDIFVFISGCNS